MKLADEREEELFDAALGRPEGPERNAFLDQACAGDRTLRARLAALFQAHEAKDSFVEPLAIPVGTRARVSTRVTEKPGNKIGPFKLLQQIGEGGCGVVYMAEQEQPLHRRVALKIIKVGMDTKAVVARFEAERQALALMDHPNIAKVLDAGATETGRPYFVMELVRGIRMTEYCDQNNLATEQRLLLFVQICHAIQHAHQKGIIHRDIKPSNILVCMRDGVPVPVVIDFGIAKATERPLTDKTIVTGFEQFVGTPAYMSPEQAEVSRLDIDTRSDIYSLGVLLYELLTGKTPFDSSELAASGVERMRQTIREQEPLRPSTRLGRMNNDELTAIARRRKTEPPQLISLVRGDLDWIAIKCLEKDRTRRYETANELAREVERYLNHELVVARPPTTAYKVRKFIRRNKVIVSASALVAVALLLGILVSSLQAVRARRAEQKAVRAQQNEAEQLTAAKQAQQKEAEARRVAEQRLYRSLVGEARARRVNRLVGYREEVFNLLSQARGLNIPEKNLAELRKEAVACLGDFVGLTNLTTEFPPDLANNVEYHPNGGMVAMFLTNGPMVLREWPSGKEIDRSHIEPGLGALRFSTTGDRLVLVHYTNQAQSIQEFIRASVVYVWRVSAQGRFSEPERLSFPGVARCIPSDKGFRVLTLDQPAGFLRLIDLDTRRVLHQSKLSPHWKNWFVRPLIDLSLDDRLVAAESADSTDQASEVDVWDLQSGRLVHKLRPQLFICKALRFNANGTHLVVASDSGLAVYDTQSFERIAFTKENIKSGSLIRFAPGTERSLIAIDLFAQHRIRIWDYVQNLDLAVLNSPHDAGGLSFSPDGKFLRMACFQRLEINHHFRLTAPEKLSLAGHSGTVPGIAFSPDGTYLASLGKDRTLKVWDISKGTVEWRRQLAGQGQGVSYSPDGRFLATTDYDTLRVSILDTGSGKVLLELGTNAPGFMLSAQFSWDSRYLATAGCCKSMPWFDATDPKPGVTVWELVPSASGEPQAGLQAKPVKAFAGQCLSLFFAPGAHRFEFVNWVDYVRSNHLDLYSWNFRATESPTLLTSDCNFPARAFGSVRAGCLFSVTPDGKQLVFAETNGAIVTLEIATGRRVDSFPTATPGEIGELEPEGRWSNARELRLSPDGTKLALTSASSLGVDVWDLKNRRLLYPLPEQKGTVYCMAWSPDSRRLAISRASGEIEIWNLPEIERVLASLGLAPE